MHAYAWRGRNKSGDLITGVFHAVSDDAVSDQLLASGVTPIDIAPAEDSAATAGRRGWHRFGAGAVKTEELMLFSRQMYTLLKAGVPIMRSFAGLQASADNPALIGLLADLRLGLDQGRELSSVMARHPATFSPFYLAMVRVGEMTGKLSSVFLRLAEHLEFDLELRSSIKQAMRYPVMVLIAMAVALVIINLFVLPTFAAVFAGFRAELPLLTRVLLGFSDWTVRWWPLVLALTVATGWLLRAWLATPNGGYRWDRWKLRLPIFGPIVLKATLARFARSFALASSSGVPISQAMMVVAQTADNAFIASRIVQMRDGVERGESLSRCAAAAGVFTPVVLQMIAVGEETGELDSLLVEIAQMYERETSYAIKGLASAIEPVLLAFIATLVLVLALGVFLPMWGLGQAAMGKG